MFIPFLAYVHIKDATQNISALGSINVICIWIYIYMYIYVYVYIALRHRKVTLRSPYFSHIFYFLCFVPYDPLKNMKLLINKNILGKINQMHNMFNKFKIHLMKCIKIIHIENYLSR